MSPQFLYCTGAFWAPTVPSTCSITRAGMRHARASARSGVPTSGQTQE
ncbi:hypothetical protein PSN_1159 [Pseudomonas sp. NGC7]